MGEVYEALDQELDLPIALKIVRPELAREKRLVEQLRREVLLARRVTHPNVCRIYDLWRHRRKGGATLFVTMELLRGETLDVRIARHVALPLSEVRDVALALGAALDAAHRAGVVHRDIKPGNIFLARSDGSERVIVTDFGIAIGPELAIGEQIGTPEYMAPEQLRGDAVGPGADLYALGAVLYECVTGRLPHDPAPELPFDELAKARSQHPPLAPNQLRPELDAYWNAAILRCLSPDPARRFRSARDLLRALGVSHDPSPRSVAVVCAPADGTSADVPTETSAATLAQEVIIGILSRGDSIRVPRAGDVFRIQRDLDLADHPADPAAVTRLLHALGVETIVTLACGSPEPETISAETWNGSTGRRLDRIRVRVERDDWLRAAQELGSLLRRHLGMEPLSAGAQESVLALLPRGEAARRAFAEGISALRRRELSRAVGRLRMAAELDPECAAIHAALADALEVSGEQAAAAAAARKAVESSALLDRREQIELEARERGFALDRDRAEELYRALVIFYPGVSEYALRLAALLAQSGKSPAALEVLSRLRDQTLSAEERLRADAIEADIRLWMGDLHGAERVAERSRENARALGAMRSLARAHQALGTARIERGEIEAGVPELEEALRLYRNVGDVGAECFVGGNLGYAALTRGRLDEAEARFRECVSLAHRLGLKQALGTPLHNLATIEARRGQPAAALALFEEAMSHHRACSNRHHMAHSLGGVASMFRILGREDEARRSWEEALAISQETGDQLAEVMLRCDLGELLVPHDPDAAFAHLERALELAEQNQFHSWMLRLRGALAFACARMGNLETALARVDAVVEEVAEPGASSPLREEILGWLDLAEAAVYAGRSEQMEAFMTRACSGDPGSHDFEIAQRCALLRAEMEAHVGRTDAAAALFEEVERACLAQDHRSGAERARAARARSLRI